MSITDTAMEQALRYMGETDERFAEAKMQLESAEIFRKRVRSRIFLTTEGTVAERNAHAETHPDAVIADQEYVEAVGSYETLKSKRQRAELTIECWRSISANRRKGNL